MDCSACGQPGAFVCTAKDEYGNAVGEWVHPFCAPQVTVGTYTQQLAGSDRSNKVPGRAQVAVPGMRIKRGHTFKPMDSGMQWLQKGRGRLHRV
jgi:hypothetical protein